MSLEGYVQGYRFSDAGGFYDAAQKRFLDQAGYGALNDLTIDTGTPVFQTVGAARGMVLDNTVQGSFLPATPWQGTLIVAWKPVMTANGTLYPFLFGGAASAPSNGTLRIVRSTATLYYHRLTTAGGLTVTLSRSSETAVVAAFTTSQSAAAGYATEDGVTITTVAGTQDLHGNRYAIGHHTGPNLHSHRARFGNLSGVIGDVAATANSCILFEFHAIQGNPFADARAAEAQAFLAALRARIGV